MNIFISSTCYDLIDLRAALAHELREMGATPLLSDERSSEFMISGAPDENSIQTCLNNVSKADAVIVVLSQRYGPKLPLPFDPVSATHMEYRQAKQAMRRRYVYARDRLLADFDLWRAQGKRPDFKGAWIKSERDHGLFELLEEHRDLAPNGNADNNNWLSTYSNVCDLIQDVRERFSRKVTIVAAEKLIEAGQVPLITIADWNDRGVSEKRSLHEMREARARIRCTKLKFTLQNMGPVPAIEVNCTLSFSDGTKVSTPESFAAAIAPFPGTRDVAIEVDRAIAHSLTGVASESERPFSAELQISYTTMLGHIFADDWRLYFKIRGDVIELCDCPQYFRKRVCGHRNFITRELFMVNAQ